MVNNKHTEPCTELELVKKDVEYLNKSVTKQDIKHEKVEKDLTAVQKDLDEVKTVNSFLAKEIKEIMDVKKKIDNNFLGGVIPDGFLLDFSDKKNPEFYLVEVELVKHSFFNHIFPQITKFFAFFKNPNSQGKLIEKLYAITQSKQRL